MPTLESVEMKNYILHKTADNLDEIKCCFPYDT